MLIDQASYVKFSAVLVYYRLDRYNTLFKVIS